MENLTLQHKFAITKHKFAITKHKFAITKHKFAITKHKFAITKQNKTKTNLFTLFHKSSLFTLINHFINVINVNVL